MSDCGVEDLNTQDSIDELEGLSITDSRPLTISRKRPLFRPPEFLKRLTGDETTKEGDSAKFTCKIVGFPRPILSWFKDDDVLEPDGTRVKITEENDGSCCIEITRLLRSDEAAYRCRAENTEGSSSSCWYMAVKSKGDKKSKKRRSRSCSPRRGVSYPPLFPTILEKVDEEAKEEEEIKDQPVSPLSELYGGVRDKRKEWFKFVGEWAFADGNREEPVPDPEESDDTEEEKIKREEENNEKNLPTSNHDDTEAAEHSLPNGDQSEKDLTEEEDRGRTTRGNRNGSPEDKDAKNRISRSEKRAVHHGRENLKEMPREKDQTELVLSENSIEASSKLEQISTSSLVTNSTNETSQKQDLSRHSIPVSKDLPEDGPSIFRPKSTDRPIQAPCLMSRTTVQSVKQGAMDTTADTDKKSSSVASSNCQREQSNIRNSERGHVTETKGGSTLNEESSEQITDSASSTKADTKGTSKAKFSPNQKSKLAAKRKRRRSIKSQKGQGFLPSPEEIFLYLTALTFFCIFFNVSPVPFILLILWGEISTCIFYSLYYGNADDTES